MGELLEKMQRRLEEWRKTQSKEIEVSKQKEKQQGNFVSRRDYGDDIEFMRGKDDDR